MAREKKTYLVTFTAECTFAVRATSKARAREMVEMADCEELVEWDSEPAITGRKITDVQRVPPMGR